MRDCKAEYVGHKSLAVNLSDIAAMGAMPLWATLNLSLPEIDHSWLEEFSNGFYALADQHDVKLIGGDLVKGPLSITIQITGYIEDQQVLLRSGCQIDDLVYVSGYLGDASMGLNILKNSIHKSNTLNSKSKLQYSDNEERYLLTKLHTPTPRFDISMHIAQYATSAIDISDGLLIDLQRILSMSDKAAVINVEDIPISDVMRNHIQDKQDIDNVLMGGEDYELIFTINPQDKNKLEQYFSAKNILITEIGRVTRKVKERMKECPDIILLNHGKDYEFPSHSGFDHFS